MKRMSCGLLDVLEGPGNELFLSVVSVAEMCIKASLGKLSLPAEISRDPETGFRAATAAAGFQLLPLTVAHAARLHRLPLHHRDPFDRLLICQAMAEDLILVSDDRAFPLYSGLALLRS